MSDQTTIILDNDPKLQGILEQMNELVPEADASHIFRAALRHFSEVAAKYDQEVYIREQLDFDAASEKAKE